MRFQVDVLFVAISGHSLSVDRASAVLRAHDMFADIFAADRSKRLEDFYLLVAYGVRVEAGGRLHRGEAKELKQVVLHHVAQSARLVVVAGATFHTERLRSR